MSSYAAAKITLDIALYDRLVKFFDGTLPAGIKEVIDLANGTSDGLNCDLVYGITETGKAASSTTEYDLAGSLTDINGNVITFKEVCLIALRNKRTTAGAYLLFGPSAANGFGLTGPWNSALAAGGERVGPAYSSTQGSWVVHYDATGFAVTAGTADKLSVTCAAVAGDTYTWDLVVIGRST